MDTGAEISVLPFGSFKHNLQPVVVKLQAANNSDIATYGKLTLSINLGLRRAFPWTFIVADVKYAILGIDFLSHYNLVVDLPHRTVRDATTSLCARGQATSLNSVGVHVAYPTDSVFADLLRRFPEVCSLQPSTVPVKHGVRHHIETTGPPVSNRPRRLAPAKLTAAKHEFEQMLRLGIIRPSSGA